MTTPQPEIRVRRQLLPFAALSASYFAHIGFFNPYLPLWLKDLGLSIFTISLLTSLQAATRTPAESVASGAAEIARRLGLGHPIVTHAMLLDPEPLSLTEA